MGENQTNDGDTIAAIITEFTEVMAFSRTRWARYAEEVDIELGPVGMMVLQIIVRKGPLTATGIGQMLEMDKSIVSRQVAKMRELELVESVEAPEDRRVQLLTASDKAQKIFGRIREQWANSYRERFANWSEDELDQLREGLHRFNAATADVRQDSPAVRCAKHANEAKETSEA
ncbi:MarR family winged helix-turn-helix transcriptional regulator [Leucobacter denitrificans]|nr:MarR family transcriptional regulator [Leucobacter denitrificans]